MRLYIPYNAPTTLTSFLKYSDIQIVKTAEVYFDKHTPIFNFDAVLYLDGAYEYNKIINKAKLANIPIYGINRYDKNEQSIILRNAGINTPDTWFSDNFDNYNDIVSLLRYESDETMLVLKYSTGARGLGQMLLTKRELIDIFDSADSVLNKLFQESNNDACKVIDINPGPSYAAIEMPISIQPTSALNKSEDERQLDKLKNVKINKHDALLNALKTNTDFTIQRYIKNRGEWRMLWFHGQEPIIVKRNIDSGEWQANACNNSAGSSVVVYMDNISAFGIDYDVIDKFCKRLNAPFMSLDLYYDEDTKMWGILEFQMEFGWTNTSGLDSSILGTKLINSIYSLISKQN